MTLDDTINGEITSLGSQTYALKTLKERVEKGNGLSDSGHIEREMAALVVNLLGDQISPEERRIFEVAPQDILDSEIPKYIPKSYKNARNKLVNIVSPNYSDILKELDGKKLLGILLETPGYTGTDKSFKEAGDAYRDYKKFEEINEKEDVKAYIEASKSECIKDIYKAFMKKYKNDATKTLKEFMKTRVEIEKSNYLVNHFIKDKKAMEKLAGAKDEKEYQEIIGKALDDGKARAYINSTVLTLNREEKENAYETAGIAYTGELAERERNSANKKAQKIMKKAA